MIYFAGYTGRKPQDLKRASENLGAIIVDVRLMPRSMHQQWTGTSLANLLGEENYMWIKDLGNVNYKTGGPIKILDLDRGINRLLAIGQPTICLCACKNADSCHRFVIGSELKDRGYDNQELDWSIANQGVLL